MKILVVDDERNIVDVLTYNLKKEGFETIEAYDGKKGLYLAVTQKPDLVLLDIMMPELDGYEVCKKIREVSQVPIIMLTARAEESDKVYSFDLGADDYITKPFSIRELMARVKAHIRRKGHQLDSFLQFGDLIIDFNLFEVKRCNKNIELTRLEFELVKYLALQTNQVFTRETLLEKVWGYEHFGDVRTVDVTIRRLRTKLEVNPDAPVYVLTKRGIGYHFTSEFGDGKINK